MRGLKGMSLRERILRTELEFPGCCADTVTTDFGVMYYNKRNICSYDANHALILNEEADMEKALTAITEFYLGHGIVPRIYQHYRDGFFDKNINILDKCGYKVESIGRNMFMTLNAESRIPIRHRMKICRLTQWDERLRQDIFLPDNREFQCGIIKESIGKPGYSVFVGYIWGCAVTVASVYCSDSGCARFDSVETSKYRRRQGYCGELIGHIVRFRRSLCGNNLLYLWPANKTAEKIYTRAGFRPLFSADAAMAVYNGAELSAKTGIPCR